VYPAVQGSFAHYLSDLDVFRHPFANLVNPEHVGGVNAGTQHNVPDDGVGFILALWGEARLDRWVGPMPTRVRCATPPPSPACAADALAVLPAELGRHRQVPKLPRGRGACVARFYTTLTLARTCPAKPSGASTPAPAPPTAGWTGLPALCCVRGVVQSSRNVHMCCATFLVRRERVVLQPREFYEAMYRWAETTVRARGSI
jgi:hypothetical protein